MHKWNLKTNLPDAHYYRTTGARRPLRTAPRQHSENNQTKLSDLPDNAPLVLVVDDNEDDRLLMSRALLRAGLRVAEATTGEEAVSVFQVRQPQVVILDLLMPCTGGLGACRLLRAEPGGQDLLILMLSGLQDAGTIRRAYDAGASDFLPKPDIASTLEDYAVVAERIRYLLRHKHLTAGNRIE